MTRIVYRVDEYSSLFCRFEHGAVHIRRRRGNDIPGLVEVRGDEGPTLNTDARALDFGSDLGSNHRDICTRREQPLEFRSRDWSSTDEHDPPSCEFQEGREQRRLATSHSPPLTTNHQPPTSPCQAVTACGATTRSKSLRLRPIVTGFATRFIITSAVL